MKKALAAALVLVIASLGLVACGGGSSSTSSEATSAESTEAAGGEAEAEGGKEEAEGGSAGSASEVAVEADPSGELAFTKDELTAKAGEVTVDFTNQASIPHNVAIESENGEQLGETEVVSGGSDSTVVDLPKGTYTYYCTIPGHRQAGMEGTLVVK
jgi:plastocyanin